jgi:hypothetical protein
VTDLWTACTWALYAVLSLATVLVIVVMCLDRGDGHEPEVWSPPPRRDPAIRCPTCLRPVRYQAHPGGRDDALALHIGFECTGVPAVRKDVW